MGQTCEACSSNDDHTRNTNTKPPRRHRSTKHSTDYHPNLTSIDSASDPDLPPLSQSHLNVDYSGSLSDTLDTPIPNTPSTASANERNIEGFKSAVLNGNDSLVMYYHQEYPELNLLDLEFPNGDNCLQVAVRNKSSKLIYYLLQNGAEVQSMLILICQYIDRNLHRKFVFVRLHYVLNLKIKILSISLAKQCIL